MTSRPLPKLPRAVHAPAGPVPVSYVLVVDAQPGRAAADAPLGMFFCHPRRIQICRELSPEQQWSTLFHEQMHAWLWDTGAVHGLDDATQERLCDAVGLARLLELQGR